MSPFIKEIIGKDLDAYLDEVKYKSAYRLSFVFTFVFLLLAIAHIYESIENLIVMSIGFTICLSTFLYTKFTKKHQLVYWTFSILGVNVVGLALNLLPTTTHYGDFIWMFSANALAFFGLPKRYSYLLLMLTFVYIGWFVIFNLNDNIELVQPRNLAQKISLFAELTSGILGGIYIVYIMTNFHNYSKDALLKSNQALSEQFDIIKSQDAEKSILVKEVHHRVKNNLQIISSLLRMQSSEIQNEEAQKHFQEAINRVMTMALIHQKLYQGESLSDVNLKQYLEDLAYDLLSVYSVQKNIDFEFNIKTKKVGLKSIVPLGLIFNELVSNTLKHAFRQQHNGKIEVSLEDSGKDYFLSYHDNGSWFGAKTNGFGTELIDTLTNQLDGTYQLEKMENGTTYSFILKNLNE